MHGKKKFDLKQFQFHSPYRKQGRKHGNHIADGWAGAVPVMRQCFGGTDRPTDGRTDTARCRVAFPRLKREF